MLKIANEYLHIKSYSKAQYYLDNLIKLARKYNSPYQYYTLEKYRDLERDEGIMLKAIKYYRRVPLLMQRLLKIKIQLQMDIEN